MSTPYPIVDQRHLMAVPKRTPRHPGRPRRAPDELPRAQAHQVLVYRVNGDYLEDQDQLRFDNDYVVNASHVSVVDVSKDRPVTVRLDVPSGEGADFTVEATFLCTVTDPRQVVRDGLYDAETLLTSYLRQHHRLLEVGLNHRLSQINEVRREAGIQVTAYTTLKPPIVTGMTVTPASVEVKTPEDVVSLEKSRRDQRNSFTLNSEKQRFDHELRGDQQRGDEDLAYQKAQHDHKMEYGQQRHDHLLGTEQQRQDQFLAAERGEFQRREFEKLDEMLGGDPRRTLLLAYAGGKISADELATRLVAEDERALTRADAALTRDYDERQRALEWDREDRRRDADRHHEERMQVLGWHNDRKKSEFDAAHTLELRKLEQAREEASYRQKSEERRMEINFEILRELAKHGHFDMANLDQFVDAVKADLLGRSVAGSQPEAVTGSDTAKGALPPSDGDAAAAEATPADQASGGTNRDDRANDDGRDHLDQLDVREEDEAGAHDDHR